MTGTLVKQTAAESVAATAKQLASPFSTEQNNLAVLRMGAEIVIHELEMEILRDPKRQISTLKLARRLGEIKKQLRALTPSGVPA